MTLAGLREPAGIFAISISIFQGNCYKLLHFCRSTLQTQCSRQVTRIMKLFVLTSKYFPKITTVSCKFHLHFLSEMMSVDCRSKISSYLIVAEDARRLQANLLRLSLKQCLCRFAFAQSGEASFSASFSLACSRNMRGMVPSRQEIGQQ